MIGLGTAALWATAVLAAPSQPAATDSLVGPGPAVPFIAQGEMLCGGAAAAMLERYWGTRRVYAEDYAHLVRDDEGGIRTTDLVLALRRRGYMVSEVQGEPGTVLEQLEDGIPAILLLGDRSPPLHYVVLTGVSPSQVHFHDPKLGPDLAAPRAELLGRWRASGYWALVARPVPPSRGVGGGGRIETPDAVGSGRAGPPAPAAAVDPGIAAALERIRAGDYATAGVLASVLIDDGNRDTELARRLLATARFRAGDRDGALEEWNRLSEPAVDLVDIRGASGTRHEVLARHAGLRPSRLLTRPSLVLARRRLADLPAVETARMDYQPLTDGTVEVRGFVTEPARWPTPYTVAAQAARALLDARTEWEVGPLLRLGERWRVHGGWSAAQRHLGSSMSAPLSWPRAVATVGIDWVRERYEPGSSDGGGIAAAERLRGGISLGRWIAPGLRLDGGMWLERWDATRRMVSARISALTLLERGGEARLEADLEAWAGGGKALARASVRAALLRSHGRHRETRALLGGSATSSSAPRTLWPGAGTGEIREPLLRAHPLAAGDAIDGAALAPTLLHATLEHRIFSGLGPLRVGGAVFLDAAHVSGARRGAARQFVDVGVGAFAAAGAREAMLALTVGASGPVLSARVSTQPGG